MYAKTESKRLYGFIAAGSQAGQLASSLSAPLLYGALGNLIVLCSTPLYELSVQFMLLRSRRRAEPPAGGGELAEAAPLQTQGGGGGGAGGSGAGEGGCGGGGMRAALASACRGFAILAGSPFLRAMTGQTLLTTFVVAGVWCARSAAPRPPRRPRTALLLPPTPTERERDTHTPHHHRQGTSVPPPSPPPSPPRRSSTPSSRG